MSLCDEVFWRMSARVLLAKIDLNKGDFLPMQRVKS